jgi:hypothetical protein
VINWKKYYQNIPSCVKIGNNDYQILWIDEFPKDHEQLGESRFEEKQIVINLNQPIKEAVHTYFHEIIHSISSEYDVNLTEKQVLNLEKSLKDFLRPDNIFKGEIFNAADKRKRKNSKRLRKTCKKA